MLLAYNLSLDSTKSISIQSNKNLTTNIKQKFMCTSFVLRAFLFTSSFVTPLLYFHVGF